MQRAEQAGLGIAIAGHVVLFGALSIGLIAAPKPVPPLTPPVDIQIVDKVGMTDTAPNPSTIEPAASVAPEVGPPVEVPLPEPVARSLPKMAPAPTPPKPAPKVATTALKPAATPAPTKPRGSRLGSDFLKGLTDRQTASTAQTPRAAAGPAVEASLAREVLRQLKPHWKAPTGADAEQLRTLLSIRLNGDGTVAAVRVIDTTGVTDSNRGQVRLHQEAAVKAVRLAAPFVLPTELYDAWKVLEPVTFDKRLG
jgi:outer membrane biosynthesis protein TonB